MPTPEEIKEIERVYQKPFSEIEKLDIPTYIRNRDAENEARAIMALEDEAKQMRYLEKERERYSEI